MIAHMRSEKEKQTVQQHLDNVAYMAGLYGQVIGLKSCAVLGGKVHDLMKFTKEFKTFIEKSFENPEKYKQGPDHSTAGGVYITELVRHKDETMVRLTAQIIAITSLHHHGGLGDILGMEAESPYVNYIVIKMTSFWFPKNRYTYGVSNTTTAG